MYTEEGIKMANDILGFIRRGEANRDFEMYREMRSSYNRNDDEFSKNVRIIWMQLVSIGLLEYKNGELTLTMDGMEAYDMEGGIEAYIRKYRKEKDLDSKVKISQIWYNWVNVVKDVNFLIGATVGAAIGVLVAWFLSLL